MNKLLTIVIPCYNTEKYLAECLDSILLLEHSDVLEVLAVNDGSRDNTLALAREYEAKYPEIRKISKAEVDAYARRRGMDAKTADRFLSHLLK